MIGNMLRERDVQYTAIKDEITNTWRILDTWNDELKNLGPEDDIEDSNSAVTILTEGAFLSLVREAARLGVLDNVSFSGGDEYGSSEEIQEMQDKIVKYEKFIGRTWEMLPLPVRLVGKEALGFNTAMFTLRKVVFGEDKKEPEVDMQDEGIIKKTIKGMFQ